jgi:hypothetical protein
MAESQAPLSTLTTVHKHHSKHLHHSFPEVQATVKATATAIVRPSSKPASHLVPHSTIMAAASKPHPIPTKQTPANTSAGSQFAYPTPSSIPRGNAAIIGLSIVVALLLVLLVAGCILWYLSWRASGQVSNRSENAKMTRVESVPEQQEYTVAGPSYVPSVVQPVRPARSSERIRTWYGRRVPSGWI